MILVDVIEQQDAICACDVWYKLHSEGTPFPASIIAAYFVPRNRLTGKTREQGHIFLIQVAGKGLSASCESLCHGSLCPTPRYKCQKRSLGIQDGRSIYLFHFVQRRLCSVVSWGKYLHSLHFLLLELKLFQSSLIHRNPVKWLQT